MKRRVTTKFLKDVVSVLTPSERDYLKGQLGTASAEVQSILEPLIYGEELDYAERTQGTYKQALNWLLQQLIIFHMLSPSRLMVYRFAIAFFLMERNPEVGEAVKEFVEREVGLDKWLNDFYWYNISLLLRLERDFLQVYLGYRPIDGVPDILRKSVNELPIMGTVSFIERSIIKIVTEQQYLDMIGEGGETIKRILTLAYEIYRKTRFEIDTSSSSLQFVYVSSIFLSFTKRLSHLPHFFDILLRSRLRDMISSLGMTLTGQILFAFAFILPYVNLMPREEEELKKSISVLVLLIDKLIGYIKELNTSQGLAHSRILTVLFLSIKSIALYKGFPMKLKDYIMLGKMSYINPFYRLQLTISIIATHFYEGNFQRAYEKHLPVMESLTRNFRIIRLAYYLWKFILEYELKEYDKLISTAHSAYQWNRREKMSFNDLVLWMKKYSAKMHHFAEDSVWQQALDELKHIYINNPFIVSVEEFSPLIRWLQAKTGERQQDNKLLEELELRAQQKIAIPFIDDYCVRHIPEWVDTAIKAYDQLYELFLLSLAQKEGDMPQ
ncbi:MAG: hypothetical protein GXO48_06005 [Chlorobi bacterium]|nr:hypothetical protein [Chlorobiota bacterium]